MSKYLKRFLTIISLIVIPLMICILTQNRVDSTTLRIEGFYQEEKDSLDVVMVGASELYCGFSPGLAYGEYGFSSYLYALDSNYLELYKYQIEEVLSRQNPKYLLIEITGGLYEINDSNHDERMATLRKFTDAIPLTENKNSVINAYADDDKLSYYLPFIMYHGELRNLKGTYHYISQQFRGRTLLKGTVSSNYNQVYDDIIDCNNDYTSIPISDKAEHNLNELLDYCKQLSCKVLFVRFPHRVTSSHEREEVEKCNYIERIIENNGFEFINFDHLFTQVELDSKTDFISDSHLNADGQKKLTRYLGNILALKGGLSNNQLLHNEENNWKRSYEYTELFYKYYDLYKDEKKEQWWYETPELLRDLDNLKTQLKD